MTEEIQLKYKWRLTWPEQEEDYSGHDGRVQFGRFYKFYSPGLGDKWMWFFSAVVQGKGQSRSGLCEAQREAAAVLEHWYDSVIAKQGKLWDPE